ncbi:MAG: type II secretion system protein GspH [Gammaproteobacteria bacterium]|nr:type II secretion system protein GspH [Gammaproteobacteria bacterium]|tara:strand:- start:5889 stop:6383 length:495 start_codon:yes stop_codon:yes gene_type:complete
MRTLVILSNSFLGSDERSVAGYTLIEVLVSLAIVALITSVSIPFFSPVIDNYQVKGAAQEITDSLKLTRQQAMLDNTDYAFILNVKDFSYQSPVKSKKLKAPENVEINLITADSELVDENIGAIRFFHDGSSTGGTITLSLNNKQYAITINWLTGHISMNNVMN